MLGVKNKINKVHKIRYNEVIQYLEQEVIFKLEVIPGKKLIQNNNLLGVVGLIGSIHLRYTIMTVMSTSIHSRK